MPELDTEEMTSQFRSNVQQMTGYVPGEQPQGGDWVKLNTNENPYLPSPEVVEAIRQAATTRLNVYPDSLATRFREVAAELFGVTPDWILPANGSDENLTILMRSFCDAGDSVVYPYPSYVLYETLAQIQGCSVLRLPLSEHFKWDPELASQMRDKAKIAFVPNPNSPTGNLWTADELNQIAPAKGVVVLDEAYGDFADQPHKGELLKDTRFEDRMVITRTLSKSYSLAGIRFGFSVANPDLTAGMQKVKDSYNCDTIAIAAATAALEDQPWMLENRAKVLATRSRLAEVLPALGFEVSPSQTNFLWTKHASGDHRAIYESLKRQKVLVRFMQFDLPTGDGKTDGLRITIGTDEQIDRFVDAVKTAVSEVS